MTGRRLAVVDIGSNTIRSLVVEVRRDGTYRVLDDEREMTRLASGLNRRGPIPAINSREIDCSVTTP